ncbi:hypothetical protein GmHk_03G007459 [Glycine max]|nr:hypothetical protein GmHk_03G007459 [Glycine max]
MDHAIDEVHEQPEEATVDDEVADVEGFPGEPHDTSVLTSYVGEVTITLDDVSSLLHLSITGVFHSFEALHMEESVLLLVELLEVSADEARTKIVQCHGSYVRL